MAFASPAPADVSHLQAREPGYRYGRAWASSPELPGLAPVRRNITDELVEQQSAAGSSSALRVFLRVRPELEGDFGDLSPEEECLSAAEQRCPLLEEELEAEAAGV